MSSLILRYASFELSTGDAIMSIDVYFSLRFA